MDTFSQLALSIIFLTTIFFHTAKKNFFVAALYGIQSFAVTAVLFRSSFERHSLSLLIIVILTFAIKVIVAPRFFIGLIKKHELKFSASTYLNTPLTLIAIMTLTAMAHGTVFAPLTDVIPSNKTLLSLALASMLVSFFLIINRKGVLSQMVGILSLENGIVAYAVFAGLEQSPVLQLGVMFDILMWLVIATAFISMIYAHFGSLDATTMQDLKE